ncbi:MAG TPA: DUF3619 family protein [Methylotenera sp.]|nr:DUF3619 family protein [Methylotenera sp.]
MSTPENKTMSEFTQTYHMPEEQVAQNVVHLLNDNAHHLSPALAQHLSAARSLAVNQLTAKQAQLANAGIVGHSGSALHWIGDHVGHFLGSHRAMSGAMMAGVMLLTFFAVQEFNFNNNLENSDAFLLASDLPPEAFADKGFDTWLVSTRD